jgi:hypothetical protein
MNDDALADSNQRLDKALHWLNTHDDEVSNADARLRMIVGILWAKVQRLENDLPRKPR